MEMRTGVKHLHSAAAEHDVGIYFESNGHGTVLSSPEAREKLRLCAQSGVKAAEKLLDFLTALNPAIGDGIAVMLAAEVIRREQGMGMNNWLSLYTELPSEQLRVHCAAPGKVQTEMAETRVVEPAGMQAEIDAAVRVYARGRAFVRPSGTEPIARVYAEAETQASATQLAHDIASLVHRWLN